MRQLSGMLLVVAMTHVACVAPSHGQSKTQVAKERGIGRIVRQMPRLRHDRGDRWPILFSGDTPRNTRFFQTYVDRGISPLPSVRRAKDVRAILPYLRYLQLRRVPVVLMGGGLVQAAYRESSGGCPHLPPARPDTHSPNFACPSWMYENPLLAREASIARQLAQSLRKHGVEVSSIWIDFESGAYLRNQFDKAQNVRTAMEEAIKCPRCVARFGSANFNTLEKYQDVVDEARAYALRVGLSNPIRSALPRCRLGNFFAHPVRRHNLPADRYPAYGWNGSGLSVSQPRCYLVPGFRGGNANQSHVDWNIFLYCVREFSNCGKVLEDGEMLVPWIGYLFTDKSDAGKRAAKGFKLASPAAYREMVIHTLMRGAETMAVFSTHDAASEFGRDYPVDFDRRSLGPLLVNLLDVQQGYDIVLGVDDMVRHGKPLNYEIQGQYNTLDEQAAVWSGVLAGDEALIRTVSFAKPIEKSITVFNRQFVLPFERTGKFFRIDNSGAIEPVSSN